MLTYPSLNYSKFILIPITYANCPLIVYCKLPVTSMCAPSVNPIKLRVPICRQ